MAFIDHIRACNAHDMSRFRPFRTAGQTAGWIHDDFIATLARRSDLFAIQPHAVTLNRELATPEQRSKALDPFLRELKDEGMIKGWRDERYPVTPRWRDEPLMTMERAAIPFFGVRAYGVHINGHVETRPGSNDGLQVWVGKRSRSKPTAPGKLDHLVAGGQSFGVGLMDNVVKECAEEAAIPESLARTARPAGFVSYVMENEEGIRNDVLFVYDLAVPADFVPVNTDGEIEDFYLWPLERVFETLTSGEDFKFNVALVAIDFLVRRGLIPPEDPDYLAIVHGLRLDAAAL